MLPISKGSDLLCLRTIIWVVVLVGIFIEQLIIE